MNKMFPWFRKRIIDPVRPFFKLEGQVELAYENGSEYKLQDGYLYGQFSNVHGIEEAKSYYQNEQPEQAAQALLKYFRNRKSPKFFIHTSEIELLKERLANFPNVIKTLDAHASRAMEHIFYPYDSSQPVNLDKYINWFYNFSYGSWPMLHVKELRRMLAPDKTDKLSESPLDERLSFDRTWDLNKHFDFLTLARSFCLTNRNNFAAEIMVQAITWGQSNPLWIGVNWLNFDVVAIRLMNWMLAVNMCLSSTVVTPQLFAEVLKFMILHAAALNWHLTHDQVLSLPAASCLYMFSANFPELKLANQWQKLAQAKLSALIEREFDDYGFHLSSSIYTHCSATEWLLLPIVQHMHNRTIPPNFLAEACVRALDALQAMNGIGKVVPRIGNYSTPGFLGRFVSISEYARSLLCLGAVALNCGQWSYAIQNMPSELLWWLGPDASEQFKSVIPYAPTINQFYFSTAGIGIIRDGWEENSAQIIVKGCPPKKYSHDFYHPPNLTTVPETDHCDFLSFILTIGKESFLIDAGSPNCSISDQDYFDSFTSHSVPIIIGEVEPCRIARLEDLEKKELPLCPNYIENINKGERLFCSPLYKSTLGQDVIFTAKRQAKLNNGTMVIIERKLRVKAGEQRIFIRDIISGTSPNTQITLANRLLFAPKLRSFIRRGSMGCKAIGENFSAIVVPYFPVGARDKEKRANTYSKGYYYDNERNKVITTKLIRIRYSGETEQPISSYFVIDWTGYEPPKFTMAELDLMFD